VKDFLKFYSQKRQQQIFRLADNGSLYFWDWKTGYNFQRLQTIPQPGSIDPEMGIYAMTFDQSGSRLITCEADKTIKIYKEDETAVGEKLKFEFSRLIIVLFFRRKKLIRSIGHRTFSNESVTKLFFLFFCYLFLCVCTVS